MSIFHGAFNARIVAVLCGLLLATMTLSAQQTSGSISGTVKDKQGAVVPGAKVTLIDQERAGLRAQDSSAEGGFTFASLTPSTYTLGVEAPGFKKWEKKDVKLYATDRLGVNDIILEVGQLSETVTVEASTIQLQTESAEKSGTITSQMMQDLAVRDRSFLSLMATLPGVVGVSQYSANVNGLRDDQNSFKVDGITNVDSGVQQCCGSWVNMDMIAEMKVVTNNATADMGRMSGAQINVVTKSGSKEFHGNAYVFKRAEWMNANSWTNNRDIPYTPRGRDRQNQVGFTLGGPLYIPKVFNANKEKLFFFVSEELWKQLDPVQGNRTMPSALERAGDFSQSKTSNNGTITVRDPLTGSPFSGNLIPSNRWNADARKLMNVFPLPDPALMTDTEYGYNYHYEAPSSYNDRLLQSYRLDYNLSDRWRLYGRILLDYNETGNPTGMANWVYPDGKSLGWTLMQRHGSTGVFNVTTIISPTLTNELVAGWGRSLIPNYLDNNTYTRANLGLSYTPLYPETVIGGYGPQVSFGGNNLGNSPSLGSNRPYIYYNTNYNMSDNVVKVMTRHTLKAGFMFELDRKDQDGGASYAGSFNFANNDSNNPNETSYQFANMLMGNFNTYGQIKKRIEGRFIYKNVEWYGQDTWKVKPNLTLDLGMRFHYVGPGYDAHGQMATFSPSLWNPAQTVRLYEYAGTNSGSGAKARDPLTGALYPSLLRGAIVPNSGNIDNGFILGGKSIIPSPGVTLGPRIGVAWQPAFLPKTVIRFGGGVFYDRIMGNVVYGGVYSPPTRRDTTLYYGNVNDVSSSLFNVSSPPSGASGWGGSNKLPMTINYNFSIQRELPYATLLEVGYVGSQSRQLIYQQPINEPAFGTAWQAWTQNPTQTPLNNGTTNLPTNYWRPYTGVGGVNLYTNGASGNYNGLQIKADKRMSRKLSFTIAYTWSRTMGVAGNIYTATNAFNARLYNYGRQSFDRTQLMTASYIYYLPKVGKNGNFLDIPGVRMVLNDWQLSGLMTAVTGSPSNFSFGFANDSSNINQRWTGQPSYGPRPLIVGDWKLPSGQTQELAQFNTKAVQVPLGGPANPSVGLESGFNYWSNPATFLSSIQTTLMKNIPFSKDGRRYVQLRLETYNTLNHHDWTGRGMSATFYSPANLNITNYPDGIATFLDPSKGTIMSNGRFGFGSLSGAANPRRLQAAIKVYF